MGVEAKGLSPSYSKGGRAWGPEDHSFKGAELQRAGTGRTWELDHPGFRHKALVLC